MLKICGQIIKNQKIIEDCIVTLNSSENYQENLKCCILDLCNKFDIENPYWLPHNVDSYNQRRKTIFTKDNFIDTINFDKFIIEELDTTL